MAANKQNGDATELDIEHELPSAESEAGAADVGELESLRAERTSLSRSAARMQAEFDNFRKRSVQTSSRTFASTRWRMR